MRKSFYNNLLSAKEKIKENRDRPAAEVWSSVKDFITSGQFSTYKKASRLASCILEGYSDSYISRILGISETTVRVHTKNTSDELYKLFGENFCDLLIAYKDNKEEVDKRVNSVLNWNMCALSLLPEELVNMVGTSYKGKAVRLKDCKKEVEFLSKYSLSNIQEEFGGLNKDYLAYLIALLDGKISNPMERGELLIKLNKQVKGGAENDIL